MSLTVLKFAGAWDLPVRTFHFTTPTFEQMMQNFMITLGDQMYDTERGTLHCLVSSTTELTLRCPTFPRI